MSRQPLVVVPWLEVCSGGEGCVREERIVGKL